MDELNAVILRCGNIIEQLSDGEMTEKHAAMSLAEEVTILAHWIKRLAEQEGK